MSFKTVGGTTPREFSIFVTSSLVFWLGCIGTGTASIASPSINLNWGVPCAPGTGASPTGITFIPPHAADGTVVEVQVAAPPGDRWEFRVDVPQPAQ